jgi:hypothetical protein
MDFELALRWVKSNRDTILKISDIYKKYTPYTDEDFLSAAIQAAIVTELHVKGTDKPFHKYFWKSFQTVLATFVPNPFADDENKHENWSTSIPSDLCDYPEDITLLPNETSSPKLEAHTEKIYRKIRRHFKPKHRLLLQLVLGLTEEGRLTTSEASLATGYTNQNIRWFINSACKKIKRLIADGTLDFKYLFDEKTKTVRKPANFRISRKKNTSKTQAQKKKVR